MSVQEELLTNLPLYAENQLKIKPKEGPLIPFKFNRAQLYLHNRLEDQLKRTGRVRAIISKGRQQGCCYTPDMRVFTADYRWVPIADIKPGQRVMAFDEEPVGKTKIGRKSSRKMRTATVEAVVKLRKPVFHITLDTGHEVKVTGEHRHLCRQRGGCLQQWRKVSDTKVGDYIRLITRKPWQSKDPYEDGWYGGMLDGEGSIRTTGAKRLTCYQRPGEVLERMRAWLEANNIPYSTVNDSRKIDGVRNKEVHRFDVHRMPYIAEVISKTRPSRFTIEGLFDGQELPGKSVVDHGDLPAWGRVVSIEPLGEQEVVDLQTSEKTFVCEGLASHNSTYVAARFYHKTVTRSALFTFIFAHDAEASSSLYDMVKTYYEESSDPSFRPHLGTSNARELLFPNLRSGYKVGTAGTRGMGRSKTFQQIHWSEVAYSPNCDDHAAGILQTVADADDTEIILESTANGQGNYFHRACLQAMSEESSGDFELIFIPWYWQDEYKRELPDKFELEQPVADQDFTSEQEYYDLFEKDGLTLEHLAWRRKKIRDDFQGDIERFCREYPFTPEEAFEASGAEAYIKPLLVRRAIQTPPVQAANAPLILGIDPARLGGDKFKVHHRKGRNSVKHERYPPMRLDQSTTRVIQDIEKYKPMLVNIDVGGLGVGLYDNLVGAGYGHLVNAVDFGGAALDPENNADMTAQMFRYAREWLEDTPVSMQRLSQKDSEAIQSQLSARLHDWVRNRLLKMQSKKEFKKEYGFSPDDADAFLLTFAKPIAHTSQGRKMMETHVAQPDWNPFA